MLPISEGLEHGGAGNIGMVDAGFEEKTQQQRLNSV
jgi:hypothetical protein